MRKFLFVVFGLAMLAAGAYVLWTAHGPQPTETRVTGGVLTTQAEIAQQGVAPGLKPDLGVTTDEGPSSTNVLGAPQIESEALSDTAVYEASEDLVRPPTAMLEPGLTTDVMLDDATDVAVAPLSLSDDTVRADGQGGAFSSTIYEQRVVELEWPASLHVGGSGALRIKFKRLADGALQPVAEIADNEVIATPILIADRYDQYDATVTATISAPNFEIASIGNLTQTLERGSEPEWRWTLKPTESGTQVIALGLNIAWTPKPGVAGSPINATIWGQTLQVKSNFILGAISVPQASIVGTALAVVGFVMQIPFSGFVLGTFWNILFGGRRRKSSRQSRRRR